MPLRRMEGEVLRDTLLYVAGRLNMQPCGPPDPLDARGDGLVTAQADASGTLAAQHLRAQATHATVDDLARL